MFLFNTPVWLIISQKPAKSPVFRIRTHVLLFKVEEVKFVIGTSMRNKSNCFIGFCLSLQLIVSIPFSSFAQSDTVLQERQWYKSVLFKTVAPPALLIGYGVSTMGEHGLFYSSKDARRDIQAEFPGFHTQADNLLVFVPIAGVFALNVGGVKGKHNYVDVTLLYGLSMAASLAATNSLKYSIRELRPDNSTYNSFPSGHTSSAFVAAEVMHQEYKDESLWYSVAGYTVGAATGVLRMMNNRHWLSDVFVGAGIGILATKVTYLYYPWFQEKVLKNKTKNLGLIPFFYSRSGGGVALIFRPE